MKYSVSGFKQSENKSLEFDMPGVFLEPQLGVKILVSFWPAKGDKREGVNASTNGVFIVRCRNGCQTTQTGPLSRATKARVI
jgi:hypothetical protein